MRSPPISTRLPTVRILIDSAHERSKGAFGGARMRIFLSYATEQKNVAEPIAFSLRSRGHHVFLDKDDLPPGQTFDDQIQKAVESSDILIFLVSPTSVAKGRYTRTELEFARAVWRHPANRVLPVMIEPTPIADVPTFLKGVTILEPHGNTTAEVAAAVERFRGGSHASKQFWLSTAAALISLVVGFTLSQPIFERFPTASDYLFFEIILAFAFGSACATVAMLLLQARRHPLALIAAFSIAFGTVVFTTSLSDTLLGKGVLKEIDTSAFSIDNTMVGDEAWKATQIQNLTEGQRAAVEQARSVNELFGLANMLVGSAIVGFLWVLGLLAGCSISAPELRSATRWIASLAAGALLALGMIPIGSLTAQLNIGLWSFLLPFALLVASTIGLMAYWMARGRTT